MIGDTYYDEDGQPLGEVHQAEDGNYVIVGYQGEIVAAASPDGTPLDPGGYEADIGEGDQYAELASEVAALQQQLDGQQQYTHQQQHAQPVPPHDPQRDVEILEANFEQVAAKAGRPLTTREVEGILSNLQNQLDAGRDVDFDKAADEAQITPSVDMNHQQRTAYMAQRLHEDQNDGLSGHQPQRETYDLDNPEQRRQWGADRLNGALSDEDARARIAQPEPEAA